MNAGAQPPSPAGSKLEAEPPVLVYRESRRVWMTAAAALLSGLLGFVQHGSGGVINLPLVLLIALAVTLIEAREAMFFALNPRLVVRREHLRVMTSHLGYLSSWARLRPTVMTVEWSAITSLEPIGGGEGCSQESGVIGTDSLEVKLARGEPRSYLKIAEGSAVTGFWLVDEESSEERIKT